MLAAPLRTPDLTAERETLGVTEAAAREVTPKGAEINLCLSGGGIRAALFHLGVLYYLYTVKRLQDVRRISSVSGGSILAAHFALRHTHYLDSFTVSADKSARSAFEFAEFARSDFRGCVFRRWIAAFLFAIGLFLAAAAGVWRWWPQVIAVNHRVLGICLFVAVVLSYLFRKKLVRFAIRYSRIRLMSRGYDRFLSRNRDRSNVTLSDLPDDPDLEILATSFTAGAPVSFSRDGITIHSVPPVSSAKGTYPISLAVAASSAFPAAFPPVHLSKVDDLLRDEGDPATSDHYVGDGGVYDNLGICNMVSRLETAASAGKSLLIISDAGMPFQGDPPAKEPGYGLVTRRAARSSDIQMNRLAILDNDDAQKRLATSRPDVTVLNCTISEEVKGSDVSELEVKVRKIRTDLNAFSPAEIHVLVRHGFNVANKMCQSHLGPAHETTDRWSPLSKDERRRLELDDTEHRHQAVVQLSSKLDGSDKVPLGLFSWADCCGVLMLVLALLPSILACLIYFVRFSLPDSPPREHELTEAHMAFPDWRDLARHRYTRTDGTLCYFEIPIRDWCRGRTVTISYEKEDNVRSVIEAHAFRSAAEGAIYELPVASLDEGQRANVTVPDCNRGDFIAVFVIVAEPSRDFFKPFRVR